MKTMKRITLTLLALTLMTSISMADNFRRFQISLSATKFVEVYSKIESLVEEDLPQMEADTACILLLKIDSKPEQLVEETIFEVKRSRIAISNQELSNIVESLYKPEQIVEEEISHLTKLAK